MKNSIDCILKNKKKLQEIKKVATTYGLRLTSSMLMSICILLTTGGSFGKTEGKTQHVDRSNAVLISVCSSVKRDLLSILLDGQKFNYEEEIGALSFAKLSATNKEVSSPTNEEKIAIILDKFNITQYQLEVCAAIACAEAGSGGMNYEETVNVICTAYNRTISEAWVNSFGNNIYDQMTAPSQFVVYEGESYLNFMGRYDLPGYQAVIDYLSNNCVLDGHHYLSFRSHNSNIDGVELVAGGNLYFNILNDEERLTDIRVDEVTRVL